MYTPLNLNRFLHLSSVLPWILCNRRINTTQRPKFNPALQSGPGSHEMTVPRSFYPHRESHLFVRINHSWLQEPSDLTISVFCRSFSKFPPKTDCPEWGPQACHPHPTQNPAPSHTDCHSWVAKTAWPGLTNLLVILFRLPDIQVGPALYPNMDNPNSRIIEKIGVCMCP